MTRSFIAALKIIVFSFVTANFDLRVTMISELAVYFGKTLEAISFKSYRANTHTHIHTQRADRMRYQTTKLFGRITGKLRRSCPSPTPRRHIINSTQRAISSGSVNAYRYSEMDIAGLCGRRNL